jgi:two-component system sensor kinase FixL
VTSRWALQRDGRGRPAAILETNNDITEQRQVEDGLHRAQSELAHIARVATLGELTASIAHEVNQPLAAVVTNGEACLRWLGRAVPDIGQARSSVEHMIKNGQRASEVVRRLRALSRKGDPSYAPVSLADVVNDVALLIGRELQSHRAALSINAIDDLPLVQGDRVQLQQVVMNLLMNGIQAMDGVNERPRRLVIEVGRSAEDPRSVVLSVSDAGPGIDPASLDRLFDAFFTTRQDGMGMGLSISRSIVEAHGGRIWATNRPEGGARFHVSLPVAQERIA